MVKFQYIQVMKQISMHFTFLIIVKFNKQVTNFLKFHIMEKFGHQFLKLLHY
jgi:hypothetical protein